MRKRVAFCNQILFQQVGAEEYVLSLGHALRPPILGTPEERREQISRVGYVGVKVNGRFSLTRARVEEMSARAARVRLSCPKVADELGVPFATAKSWIWEGSQTCAKRKTRRQRAEAAGERDPRFKATIL